MSKNEFRAHFERALEVAAENAETKLGRAVARTFEIEMHAFAPHTRILPVDTAFEEVYLGQTSFILTSISQLFVWATTLRLCSCVRVDIHQVREVKHGISRPGWGPFKQILPVEIKLV